MTVNGIRLHWNAVRDASGLKGFRPYYTRHTAITRYAEAGVRIEVIKAKAGHISDRMNQHHTQISLPAQRRWTKMANTHYGDGRYAQTQPSATKMPPIQHPPHSASSETRSRVDLTGPEVQAEIARHVALALQNARQNPPLAEQRPASFQLLSFPGGTR